MHAANTEQLSYDQCPKQHVKAVITIAGRLNCKVNRRIDKKPGALRSQPCVESRHSVALEAVLEAVSEAAWEAALSPLPSW